MTENQPEFYFKIELPPLGQGVSVFDWRAASDTKFREMALALAQRLDDHGVSDGYEISTPNIHWMKVKATTPQCALLLKCWGEHDRRTPPLPGRPT